MTVKHQASSTNCVYSAQMLWLHLEELEMSPDFTDRERFDCDSDVFCPAAAHSHVPAQDHQFWINPPPDMQAN